MARNDLELAKSIMTPEQLQQWSEARSRSEVADYENDSAHQIVSKDDYIAMKMTVTQLNEEITRLEGLPYQQVKNENNRLVDENEILAGQLETLNIDYENATNQKAIMDANYADIEETLSDKVKEFEQSDRLDNLNRELSSIEVDFGKIKGDVARRLQNLKTLRKSKQSEIDEILNENRFLVGRHRQNQHEIHELIQERLSKENIQNVIDELQQMLVEEKTSGELKARKLLDERARLEESIQEMRLQAKVSNQQQADELRSAKEQQAEMENLRLRLDQETRARKNIEKMYEETRRELKTKRQAKKAELQRLKKTESSN